MITSNKTIAPKNTPPINAFLNAILGPALIARAPPVMAPDAILLIGSSTFLSHINEHYDIEYMPAHIAKLPNYNRIYLRE